MSWEPTRTVDREIHAVLVGVNSYRHAGFAPLRWAEKDCTEVRAALSHPETGSVDPVNAHLLVGEQATTRDVKATLRRVAGTLGSDDVLLVYFAGHGFVSADGATYLATYDLDPGELVHDPDAGLSFGFLWRNVVGATRAFTIGMYDACYSGGMVESAHGERLAQLRAGIERDAPAVGRHVALAACAFDGVTRESDQLQGGVFSRAVLRGLAGDAQFVGADDPSYTPLRFITVENLVSFVVNRLPHQAPHRYGFIGEPIRLSRPISDDLRSPVRPAPVAPAAGAARFRVSPLPNVMDRYVDQIVRLETTAPQVVPGEEAGWAADVARRALQATGAVILHVEGGASFDIDGLSGDRESVVPHLPTVVSVLSSTLSSQGWNNAAAYDVTDLSRRSSAGPLLAVPLTNYGAGRYSVAIVGPTRSPVGEADVVGSIVRGISEAARRFRERAPSRLTESVIDALRATHGRVPSALYDLRFARFQDRLASLALVYQPVVSLATRPEYVKVQSWEALARDASTMRAPIDLFETGEAWGQRFLIELDLTMAVKAIQAWTSGHPNRSDPLCVNVYPDSLVSTAFVEAIRNECARREFPPQLLTFEISEKRPLLLPRDADPEHSVVEAFAAYIRRLNHEDGFNFAIDDFGTGFASIERLSGLGLSHVKIDRSVLLHRTALEEITLTQRVAIDHGVASRVIVEGFDQDPRIAVTLPELAARRLAVQGYFVRRPEPSIVDLSEDERVRIAAASR
jgi:EAL domain-containing protein (putative c-di-GMP-specific phosphodiesterase class I)